MVFARIFGAYERALTRRPLATKMLMSAAVLGTADVGAQGLQHYHKTKPKPANKGIGECSDDAPFALDMRRQGAVACYSTAFQGPFGHYWYQFLENGLAPMLPNKYVVPVKVLFDQAVNALASNVIYFSFIPYLEGKPVDEIKQKLRMDLGPTYAIDCLFWPATSYFNFRYVPVRHQLLCCNVVLLGWTLFMSYVCHDDALLRSLDEWNIFLTDSDRKMLERRGLTTTPLAS